MTSIHDAANGLADAIEAGRPHEHSEIAQLAATVTQALAGIETRLRALEAGVVVPEPENPPTEIPADPWPGYTANRVGYALELVRFPDGAWERIADGDTASLEDAFAAGQAITLPAGARFTGVALRGHGYIKAEGTGAIILGRGTSPIVRFDGDGALVNVLLYGDRSRRSTAEDGVKVDAGNVWCDRVAVANVWDEQMDLWDPGRKRITWTRSAFLQPGTFGPLMGSNNLTRPTVDQWATFYRCHFETDGRQPRIAATGATAHLINCVHPWWAMKYNRAVDTADGGVAIVEGAIVGAADNGAGEFVGGSGSWYTSGTMHVGASTSQPSRLGIRPALPYAHIPAEQRTGVDQQRALGRAISAEAGPEIAVKERSL
jgi:hypothetical protein